jgi:hypothetical protein
LAEARAALIAAIVADGLPAGSSPGAAEPPCALVFGQGLDVSDRGHVARGQVPALFRVTVLGGLFEDADLAGAELAAAQGIVLGAVRGLAGWRLDDVRADYVAATPGGGRYLAADVIAAVMIEL